MDEQKTRPGMTNVNFSVVMHNFFAAARRLLWLFVLLAALVGGLTYYRTDATYIPQYSTSAVFMVRANYAATTDILSSSNYMDKSATQMLAATFPYVIQSETTQALLRQYLHADVINGSISATTTADTALFTLTVTSTDPHAAYDILKATIAVYPNAASSILGDTQIHIINEPAAPPTVPINQNTARKTALAYAGLVLLVGLFLIFLLSLSRRTVHSADDLRKLVNLKCMAYIPSIKLKKHSSKERLHLTITNPNISASFTESIRNLRVKLIKYMDDRQQQVLLITSTMPNEGKSTIATNLALSLASEGKRVILIDGDLRKQALKASIGINDPSDGLAEILQNSAKNFRLLQVPGSSLVLLSGDMTYDQPQALLDSPRMKQVIELLRERMDYIIIDAPPAGILSDAATMAKYTDAVLYVVRQDLAATTQILSSIQSLSSSGANLVGCVLNKTQVGTTRTGYGSKYGNSYGYGYNYGYKYAAGYGRHDRSKYNNDAAEYELLTRELHDAAEHGSDE